VEQCVITPGWCGTANSPLGMKASLTSPYWENRPRRSSCKMGMVEDGRHKKCLGDSAPKNLTRTAAPPRVPQPMRAVPRVVWPITSCACGVSVSCSSRPGVCRVGPRDPRNLFEQHPPGRSPDQPGPSPAPLLTEVQPQLRLPTYLR